MKRIVAQYKPYVKRFMKRISTIYWMSTGVLTGELRDFQVGYFLSKQFARRRASPNSAWLFGAWVSMGRALESQLHALSLVAGEYALSLAAGEQMTRALSSYPRRTGLRPFHTP